MALLPPGGSNWNVHLPPGRYVVTVSFTWSGGKRAVDETGIIGLLASRTARLGIVATPACG